MGARENFYRRDPGLALQGMSSMSLEERGVYNTVIDLLYLTWRPLEDDRGYIAGHCRCAVQKLNPILGRLIAAGKLIQFEEDGRAYISEATFERDLREPATSDRPYIQFWKAIRAAVFERDGYVCCYCGSTDGPFEPDHVVPVAAGGPDTLDNLVCACRSCNRSKGAKSLSEWMAAR